MNTPIDKVEDLLTDERFLAWYYKTDTAAAAAWEVWIQQNPEKKELLEDAKRILESLQIKDKPVRVEQSQRAEAKLMSSIDAGGKVLPLPVYQKTWRIAAVAAIVFILLSLSIFKPFSKPPSI